MQKKCFPVCLLAIAFFVFGPSVSHATTVERLTLDDMARKSHSIVLGTVRGSRTFWTSDGKLILTTYTVEVQESLKGQSGRTAELTVIGGQVGDTVLHVAGMPSFRDGETAIVFIEQSGGYSVVVGLGQGKFKVSNGEVENAPADLTFADGRPARVVKMPLATFRQQVRSIVDRQR